jgi:hypothetical protein
METSTPPDELTDSRFRIVTAVSICMFLLLQLLIVSVLRPIVMRLAITEKHSLTCFPKLWRDFSDLSIKLLNNKITFKKQLAKNSFFVTSF